MDRRRQGTQLEVREVLIKTTSSSRTRKTQVPRVAKGGREDDEQLGSVANGLVEEVACGPLGAERAAARAPCMIHEAIGPMSGSGRGPIGNSARSSRGAGANSIPYAATSSAGGAAAVAKFMAELPPAVTPCNSSDA